MTATGCGDGWPLAREMVWGDANRFPEQVVLVDFTGAGMPNTWDPNIPPPTLPIFYYYLHDALGSVVALTDNVGRLVERYTYDPYGRVVVERPHDPDGPASGEPCDQSETGCDPVAWKANICGGDEVLTANSLTYSAYGNPFMWTGQRYDAVTGTYHFHARTYLPHLGRWGQRDPEEYVDGVNLYEGLRSNPIQFQDPYGDAIPAVIAGGAAISVADAIAATFGLSLAACMATPQCRDAVYAAIRKAARDAAEEISRAAQRARDRAKDLARAVRRRWRDGYRRRGKCTPDQHAALQAAVDLACKSGIASSCDSVSDCDTILANLARNMACLQARNAINGICFSGGDDGHKEGAENAREAAFKCVRKAIDNHCFKRSKRPGHDCNK